MAKGTGRDLALERRWRRIILQQRRSGLSIRAFCRQEALAESSFAFWKRELRRRDHEAAAARPQATASGEQIPGSFVELTTPASEQALAATATEVPIELQISDRRLLLRPGCSMELLGQVLRLLEGSSC